MDDVAELADHVVILDHGRVVADGTPREVFTTRADALESIGIPSAQAFAERLAGMGLSFAASSANAAENIPLTIDELAASLTEVLPHGAAR